MWERVEVLAKNVDDIVLIRASPRKGSSHGDLEDVRVVDVPPRRDAYLDNFILHTVLFPLQVAAAVLLTLATMVRRRRRPDVVHGLDYVLSGAVGATVATLTLRPLVVSVRGFHEPNYREMAREQGSIWGVLNYYLILSVAVVVLNRANHVITKSAYQKDVVRSRYHADPPMTTVPTGVDYETFEPRVISNSSFEELLGLDRDLHDRQVFIHLGKLNRGKGVDVLVRFLDNVGEALPEDAHFLLLGEYQDSEFAEDVKSRLEEMTDRATVYPHRVDFELVPRLLKSASGVVLLSGPSREGVPRILQEACVMETPIVASDVTGIKNAFGDRIGCYLVGREDPDEFVAAISTIVNNPPEMDCSSCRDSFDIERNYSMYSDIYKSLVE